MCRRRSDPAAQNGEVSCAGHVKMGDVKDERQSGDAQINWDCREDHSQLLLPTPMKKLLSRIIKELAKGKARRAVPSWSIP